MLADFCIFIARHYLFREELLRARGEIFVASDRHFLVQPLALRTHIRKQVFAHNQRASRPPVCAKWGHFVTFSPIRQTTDFFSTLKCYQTAQHGCDHCGLTLEVLEPRISQETAVYHPLARRASRPLLGFAGLSALDSGAPAGSIWCSINRAASKGEPAATGSPRSAIGGLTDRNWCPWRCLRTRGVGGGERPCAA